MWRLCFLLTLVDVRALVNNDWDLLIFTQHWPSTVCLDYEEENPSHYCARTDSESSWTIHGVWPTKLHTRGPGFCNKSLVFDPSQLTDIRDKLLKLWPNIQGGNTDDSLWEHEWTKHGTCAVALPSLDSEAKYFQQGLSWLSKFDMTAILGSVGILPSDDLDYSVESIHDAVKQGAGVNPRIECVLEKHTKNPFLFEIRICFDKTLTPVGCEGTDYDINLRYDDVLTNCPADVKIRYPKQFAYQNDGPTPPTPPEDDEEWKFRVARIIKIIVNVCLLLTRLI